MAQEVILLGATVAQPATDYGGQYLPLTHVEQKLKTVNYRWNPNTLAYEVETVTGGGTGTDVNVTNVVPITATSLPLPTGAATAAKQDTISAQLPAALDGSGGLKVAVIATTGGGLTDTQLRASAVPVSGTFWQTTQPVSGPLTDTQLRATAVPVSGTFFQATQPVSIAATLAVSSKTDLAVNAPATVTVGVSSATAVAANGSRKGLYLTNTSSTQRISLAFDGATAVLDSGITLYPQDVFWMDEYDFTNGAVAAIASAASASLGIQEYQ